MKIISNGTSSGTRVYTDEGHEIKGISQIDFDSIKPNGSVNVELTFESAKLELRQVSSNDPAKVFLEKLYSLLKNYSAELFYTNEDDGVHVAIFGDDIFNGRLHGDDLNPLRKAISKLDV